MIIHIVEPLDSVYSIAAKYGVPVDGIIKDNEIVNPDMLVVGQTIVISDGTKKYVVKRGDSLYLIAKKNGVSVNELLNVNPQIKRNTPLQIGQVIIIPINKENKFDIKVNGFAFPSINMEVLKKTLPSLTFLSIFSYDVKPDGTLNTLNDEAVISEAKRARVAPLMVISNIEEGAGFSSDLVRTILLSDVLQNKLINNVIEVLQSKGYYGLNVDFEYVYPADREKYNAFLRKITSRLRAAGFIITTSVAPKLNKNQKGRLYEAHDYPVHGSLVDYVVIMTYEWGYTFGPAQAVAPLSQVRRVLNYATGAIPSNKILLGVPNYGYDWALPFVQGSAAKSLTNKAAVSLAARVGANIKYDISSEAPFFNYYDSTGKRHEVWFEDARSMQATLRVVKQYGLAGISIWTINSYSPQSLLVLNAMSNIVKVL